MPADVTVTTDPVLVYGMVGLLFGALVLALVFAWPRSGLGAATKSDADRHAPGDGTWMPGGDIFGHDQPAPPRVDPGVTPPPAAPHDPWSTGASEQSGQQPRWDRP